MNLALNSNTNVRQHIFIHVPSFQVTAGSTNDNMVVTGKDLFVHLYSTTWLKITGRAGAAEFVRPSLETSATNRLGGLSFGVSSVSEIQMAECTVAVAFTYSSPRPRFACACAQCAV